MERTTDDERLTHDFDPTVPETFTSAHEEYKRLRAECPVAHSNAYNGFWALFRYEDVENVLKDYQTFTTSVQNTVPKFAFTGRRPPLHFDPPEHSAYRRVINRFFTDEKMAALAPKVRRDAAELMQALVDKGEGDFSLEYANRFPPYVFAEFFNVPKSLSMNIKEISAAYVKAIQEMDDETVKSLSLKLYDIARMIIAERKANPMSPDDDLTAALLEATYEGRPLPEDLVLGCVRQLLVTGMVAPSVILGSIFVHLATFSASCAKIRRSFRPRRRNICGC